MGVKALKKFGQNYLIDKNIVNKLIAPLELSKTSSLIEIGPGKGFITSEICKIVESPIGIEIDSRVIEDLKENYPKLRVIEKDFMKVDLSNLECNPPLKIIGNVPFNLTGNILFKLLNEKDLISNTSLIIPLDIAKRMTAQKRTKEYGILTVLFNYFSTTKIITKVSPNVFLPKPNIAASIIHINFNKPEKEGIKKETFIKVVKASFGNRRKTLNNSLRNSIFTNCDFTQLDLDMSKRAEELEVADFLKLTEYIQNQ